MAIVTCQACGARNRVDQSRAESQRPKCGRCGAALELARVDGPIEVSDETLIHVLHDAGDLPVLVDCWAPWCGPCRMVAPTIDALAAEANGRYIVAKLNTDESPRIAAKYGINSIPTFLVFRNGVVVDRAVGVQPKQALQKLLLQRA